MRELGCRLTTRLHEWNKIQLISLIMDKMNVHLVKQLLENKWIECQLNKCIPVEVN